jgi:hypothetical protein
MAIMCATGQCQTTDKIWGIINKTTNRLHRLTFSKNLADFICARYPEFSVTRFSFKLGDIIERGAASSTGIYGIMSGTKHFALRASLIKEAAEMYTEDPSRYLQELKLFKEA